VRFLVPSSSLSVGRVLSARWPEVVRCSRSSFGSFWVEVRVLAAWSVDRAMFRGLSGACVGSTSTRRGAR